ncbi:hypothetical protein BD410DRAFT_812165 [Rickenella mellea]|uniref:Uncharacterized protein n=1 Tax=Rickenella mellea TaxID=50990 RepID=A0A4Y7QL39_9AGAM|nr:hypothetical protein BD410DRAFT_812165 [Rickenella mellea]
MWCDNCLLLLPLRAGAMAWGVIIALYSIAGGVLLLKYGNFLYFLYPEWQLYGGVSVGVGVIALINVFALSNRSYIWTRVCKFVWPFIIVLSAIRAIIMIVRLQQNQYKIAWECDHGGQQWSDTTPPDTGTTIPSGFCTAGFSSLNTAFIVSLLVDIGFQLYALFLNWRFATRLEHYQNMHGPYGGGRQHS